MSADIDEDDYLYGDGEGHAPQSSTRQPTDQPMEDNDEGDEDGDEEGEDDSDSVYHDEGRLMAGH
jgi:hypothetical protein